MNEMMMCATRSADRQAHALPTACAALGTTQAARAATTVGAVCLWTRAGWYGSGIDARHVDAVEDGARG